MVLFVISLHLRLFLQTFTEPVSSDRDSLAYASGSVPIRNLPMAALIMVFRLAQFRFRVGIVAWSQVAII